MLLLSGACVLAIQMCVFCTAAFAETGETAAGERKEEGETGQWGRWGEWNACSAECSSGITVRTRRCQQPYMLAVASLLSGADDSVHCSGADKEIKLCNKQACGEGRGGWREEECAKYDTSVHVGRRYTWLPFIHPSDPCKLTCRAKGHHFYSNLADRVVDGTPCAGATTHPTAVCLQGQCQEVGCDDVVGSPWRADVCGVCKGDNSTCRKMSGLFRRQDLQRGMNLIAAIPSGATRIRVKGLRYSNNWLALQTSEGAYVLNGEEKRSGGREVEVAGTVFSYRTKRRCAGQCLLAKGPTTHALRLMLNTRGRNRGVMYSFNIPLNVSNSYFRRIISTARAKADLVRNASSPHLPPTVPNRRHGQFGHEGSVDKSSNGGNGDSSSSISSSSSSSSSSENQNNPVISGNNEDQVEASKESGEKDAVRDVSDSGDDEQNVGADNSLSSESSAQSAEKEDSIDSDSSPDESSMKSRGHSLDNDHSSSPTRDNAEKNVEAALNSNSHENEDILALKSSEEEKPNVPTNITFKERPRFIDSRVSSKNSFENKSRTSEFRSNAQPAESGSEEDGSPNGKEHHSSLGSDSDNSVDDATTPAGEELLEARGPAAEEEDDGGASEMSDLPADQGPDVSAEDAGPLGLPQSDGPRQQHHAPRTVSRNSRQRSWRRFRRPNYSQSFTFRGRRRHDKSREDRRHGARPSRPGHADSSRGSSDGRIRYRQHPRGQVPQGSGSVSAYGQGVSGRPSYSGSNARVYSRQYPPSQRQALRAGQGASQNQDRGVQLAGRNRQQPQQGSAPAPRLTPQGGGSQEQGGVGPQPSASQQEEEYQRQLQRRRQLIEQQIAAQNAEYQRRLEERNQRLRQQHLERQQQRHRHGNDSVISRPHRQHPQGGDDEERQTLPQERNREASPIRGLSGRPRGSSQPEGGVSAQINVNVQQTPPPPGPSNPGSHFGAGDGGRPLVISNRRPTQQQELQPPVESASGSEEHLGHSGSSEGEAEPNNAFSQRSRNVHSTPSPGGVGNIPESVNGQRPLIISNRRQPLHPETSSPPSSTMDPVGPPSSSPHAASGASPLQPSTNRQSIVSSHLTPSSGLNNLDNNPGSSGRKWPLFISNRRQEPGKQASRPAVPGSETAYEGGLPVERTPHNGFGPSQVQGPSQSGVASQGRQAVDPSVPDGVPSQARPPARAAVPGISPDHARPPTHPSAPGIPPSTASLGGGFVAPQYIPENTRGDNGRSELSASSPNQLPSGGESPLVIGAEGNVIPTSAESGLAIGGGGSVLAIDEAGHSGSYVWRVSGLTECTLTCGGGVQQTVVVCLDTRTQAFVTDDNCQHLQRPPTKAVTCNTRPCPAQWQPGRWSACSVSCGVGDQTRLVHCLARISPTLNVTMADDNCRTAEKPQLRRECHNVACNSWKVGNWSECSEQCGEGRRTRDVYCSDQTGYDVSDDLCASSGIKPSQEEACVVGPCGKGWYYTDWPQKCPGRCGASSMRRQVTCLGSGGAPLPDSSCNDTSRPPAHQDCSADGPCGGQWFAAQWSQCNVSCGSGHQEREVLCLKRGLSEGPLAMVGEENCPPDLRPHSMQPCEMDPCLARWYMTSWTECSQSCGRGQRTREVKCLDPQQLPSSQCAPGTKPLARDVCNVASCVTTPPPAPAVSECRDTFSRCQLVKHARMCRFSFYRKKCCATCSGDT